MVAKAPPFLVLRFRLLVQAPTPSPPDVQYLLNLPVDCGRMKNDESFIINAAVSSF